MFEISKRFCEDLIRNTCSNVYYENMNDSSQTCDRNKNATTQANANLKGCQVKINVMDVFKTICKNDKYDFLTNKYMAKTNNKNLMVENSNNIHKRNFDANNTYCYDVSKTKIK